MAELAVPAVLVVLGALGALVGRVVCAACEVCAGGGLSVAELAVPAVLAVLAEHVAYEVCGVCEAFAALLQATKQPLLRAVLRQGSLQTSRARRLLFPSLPPQSFVSRADTLRPYYTLLNPCIIVT